jgi:hypothetical protein
MRRGFAAASKELVFYTGGGGQYDPAEIHPDAGGRDRRARMGQTHSQIAAGGAASPRYESAARRIKPISGHRISSGGRTPRPPVKKSYLKAGALAS